MPQGRRLYGKSNAPCAMPLMRGVATLPGSKNTSRAKGIHRKLGDPAFCARRIAVREIIALEERKIYHSESNLVPEVGIVTGVA
jgi:hypothetical protein